MNKITFNPKDNIEYQAFLNRMSSILTEIKGANQEGLTEIFYKDEDLYLGKGEYTPIVFEALYAIGCRCEADCTFGGSGIYIRWGDGV